MIGESLRKEVAKALETLGASDVAFSIEPTELIHGDYATNAALVAGKMLKKNPREVAEALKQMLEKGRSKLIGSVEVAGPGFVNIRLSEQALSDVLASTTKDKHVGWNTVLKGKNYIVEYTDPNPFKEFHIGHLMSNTIGEAISRLVEASGADTKRACYQGDVGLHVAKAIWGVLNDKNEYTETQGGLLKLFGWQYSHGAIAYEKDSNAKKEITEINKKIYDRSDKKINEIYDSGKSVSLQGFEEIYQKLGTKFDYYFFESQTGYWGRNLVKATIDFVGTITPASSLVVLENKIENWVLWQRVLAVSNEDIQLNLIEFEQVDKEYFSGLSNFGLLVDGRTVKKGIKLKNNKIFFDLQDCPLTMETGSRVIALAGDIDKNFKNSYSFKLTKLGANESRTNITLPGENILNAENLQSGTQYSVFSKSDGAIVYKGDESKGLHTRVFINKEGLPTYEAKELGLAKIKHDAYPYDRSIVVTGNEVNDYFRVLLDVMSKIFPELSAKTEHIGHGMMRLPSGKMSSRTGDVITAESMIADVKVKVLEKMSESPVPEGEKDAVAEQVAIGAIKYSILRQAPGKDIIFDIEQATSFEGDSGPYLQYTHARTHALLKKGKVAGIKPNMAHMEYGPLSRRLARFADVVSRAERERAPQFVVTYLIELAQEFNSYYGNTQIVDEKHKDVSSSRLALSLAVGNTLRSGLWMLGIRAPETM